MPTLFTPMLATSAPKPFDSPDHLFELKWDGVRTLAFCEGDTKLFSRTGREVTVQYPEFIDLHAMVNCKNAVLDAEIVALDPNGRPSFELLQRRINLSNPRDIAKGVGRVSLDLVVFDIVFVNDEWIGGFPLVDRLSLLNEVVAFDPGGRVLRSEAFPTHGVALFEAAGAKGLEGIVAKRADSHYLPGKRSRDWLKIKFVERVDCVIGGWTLGQGGRGSSLGALLLGLYEEGNLRFVGSVGTGFTDSALRRVKAALEQKESETSPFSEKVPVKGARWVKPALVAEVEYREVTSALKLRAPSFKGLRPDKLPEDCSVADLAH